MFVAQDIHEGFRIVEINDRCLGCYSYTTPVLKQKVQIKIVMVMMYQYFCKGHFMNKILLLVFRLNLFMCRLKLMWK